MFPNYYIGYYISNSIYNNPGIFVLGGIFFQCKKFGVFNL